MPKAAIDHRLAHVSTTEPGHSGIRFTLDGAPELEARLGRICHDVLTGLLGIIPEAKLEALLLGGGYGRGEGGVLRTVEGDEPYNDVEFYCFVRGNRFLAQRRYGGAITELTEQLSVEAGVEVEAKLISFAQLRVAPISMFYYDLAVGHRWIRGDEELLRGCEHHRDARRLPLTEATRLLMNRCTGLLLANEKLKQPEFVEADFVARNLAKVQLALGDAVLTTLGQYHWSCRERHRRLLALPEAESFPGLLELIPHHLAGVDFKLHPYPSTESAAELDSRYRTLSALSKRTWLWLESRRLQQPFASVRDYSLGRFNKVPESAALRNRLMNLRLFGPLTAVRAKGARHPRERLFNALPLLLWENPVRDDEVLHCLQRNLRTRSRTRAGLVDCYLRLWRQVR